MEKHILGGANFEVNAAGLNIHIRIKPTLESGWVAFRLCCNETRN